MRSIMRASFAFVKKKTSVLAEITPVCTAVLLLAPRSHGFAYAPNFITNIIQEQTGLTPKGLAYVANDTNSKVNNSTSGLHGGNNAETAGGGAVVRRQVVRTRFPPEPNGYLHLGHAKAITFNFAVARMFDGGACHMRLDDTNPSNEEAEYVDSILEDVRWVQSGLYDDHRDGAEAAAAASKPWAGAVRKTSDYFDQIYQCAVALIESGDAYVDSLTAEQVKAYRGTLTEPGQNSPYRDRSVAENLQLFAGMKDGHYADGQHVLRAKIDMSSPNMNLRDPAIYRIKHEPHQETGRAWCIYPMYDFSHPIADALENITHSLCSLEFEDHRPLYDWTIAKLLPTKLIDCQPQQIEFSRLNIKSTVLSKRKLIRLVQKGYVSGWNDPRMPTLCGLRRRGISPQALRLFCERVGVSKSDSNIDYGVLEDCVRESMEETSPRAFGVLQPLKVTVTNWDRAGLEVFEAPRHPKFEDMGTRKIPFGREVYIERSDFFDVDGPEGEANGGKPPRGFKRLLPKNKVRLRFAYVINCDEVVRDAKTNEPVELKCTYYPETRAGFTPDGVPRVQGIIHWVEASSAVGCAVNLYDRLFRVDEPGKESGDFLRDINTDSLRVLKGAVVEPSVLEQALDLLEKIGQQDASDGSRLYHSSLALQFERNGYFALDIASQGPDSLTFNRVVTLRDTWGVKQEDTIRSRGSQSTQTAASPRSSSEPIEDIRRIAFCAATIENIEPHPEADNLVVCKVDCGDVDDNGMPQRRTVVAGLAGKIDTNKLIGSKVVAVTNLKPAIMRGIESTAMLLVASDGILGDDEAVDLLHVPSEVPNGEILKFEGKEPSVPDAMLKSKGALKAWERAKSGLRTNDDGEAVFFADNGAYRMLSSAGSIRTTFLKQSAIQ